MDLQVSLLALICVVCTGRRSFAGRMYELHQYVPTNLEERFYSFYAALTYASLPYISQHLVDSFHKFGNAVVYYGIDIFLLAPFRPSGPTAYDIPPHLDHFRHRIRKGVSDRYIEEW